MINMSNYEQQCGDALCHGFLSKFFCAVPVLYELALSPSLSLVWRPYLIVSAWLPHTLQRDWPF